MKFIDLRTPPVRPRARRFSAALVLAFALAAPAVPASAQNLALRTATYLGGPNGGAGDSTAVAPDGTLVWAGALNGTDLGFSPARPLGGAGAGAIVRLNGAGTAVLSVTRLGAEVREVRVNPANGNIAACGDFGVAVLNPTGTGVVWSDGSLGAVSRIAIASDGTVAALSGLQNARVTVYDARGVRLSQQVPRGVWYVRDVAVDAATRSVFYCGDYNTRLPSGQPVRIAFVASAGTDGAARWWDYGWGGGQLTGLEADSQADRLRVGRDGFLYLAGATAGGNTIFGRDPKSLSAAAPLSTYDPYSTPYQTGRGGRTFAFAARLRTSDGAFAGGQFLIPRLAANGTGDGNSAFPTGIDAAEDGTVFVALNAAAFLPNRAGLTLSGIPVPAYAGDASVAILAPDLSRRLLWTTWGGGKITDVSAGFGTAALSATAGGGMVTVNALQPSPPASMSGFLSAWTVSGPGNTGGGSTGSGPQTALGVNAGGGAAGPFGADRYATGGSTYQTGAAIDTGGAAGAAPAAVYQSERYGTFTYTLPAPVLPSGQSYTVKLHFAEIYWTGPGRRVFNVSVNGAPKLSNYDIYARTGARNKAIVETLTGLQPDGAGRLVLSFAPTASSPDKNAKLSGLEVLH